MNGEYDRLRQLLLDQERERLDALRDDLHQARARFERVPDRLAEDIERSLQDGRPTRLTSALAEATTASLELAVQRKPQTVVNAVYPVIGPAIRRSLQEAMRQLARDLDRALGDSLSPRALAWRWEAWRSGVPYAQVVLRRTSRYRVEHLFLIQPESGLLLGHLTASGLPELDADAVAGMFTAIQQFVRDSVSADEPQAGGIGAATVGDYQLVVSEGPRARLVAFVRGVPSSDFAMRLDELNENLHAGHGEDLAGAVGGAGAGLLEQAQLDALNERPQAAPAAAWHPARYLLWALLVALLLWLAWWVFSAWRWSSQSEAIGRQLAAAPGLIVTRLDDGKRGQLRIDGLLDPLAADPRQWLAAHYPKVRAQWRLRPFVSLEPALTGRRVARALALPDTAVSPPDADGVVRLRGAVPFADWFRVRRTQLTMPGVSRLDASGLSYPQQARVDALIDELETLNISFSSGTVNPEGDWERTMAKMSGILQDLERIGTAEAIAFRVLASGLTDESGSPEQNRALREQRAAWLAARLAAQLPAASPSVAIDRNPPPGGGRSRIARASVEALPLPAEAAR